MEHFFEIELHIYEECTSIAYHVIIESSDDS